MKLHRENRIIPKGSLIRRVASGALVTEGNIYELLEDYDPTAIEVNQIKFIMDDGNPNNGRYESRFFELYKLNNVELDNIFII